jgi:L-aspartate oxidase
MPDLVPEREKLPLRSARGGTSGDEVIVIGGGLAGLFCALKLAPHPVTLLTSAPLGEGASSAWAQGGIAAAVAEGDTPDAHARDTVAAGAGLVDADLARAMAREAPARIHDLLAYGVPFDKDLEGRLLVGQEAAHSARRIVHVEGDRAGHAILQALVTAIRRTPSVRVLELAEADELLVQDGRVVGVRPVHSVTRRSLTMPARAVVLASGGIGHLYAVTTNPPQARGTGLAIAARAGARLADTEFVQFHPTAIDVGRDPAPLASEAIRGEGAILVNGMGERFMKRHHRDAELAPRDVVARAVFAEIAAGRGAFLDTRAALGQAFAKRFPTVHRSCIDAGIDPLRRPIPIAPAAHYHMGGVWTDVRGRTSLQGLWAAGECAATGVHGANRLASNSLLEAVVFAARVAEDIAGLHLLAAPSHWPTSEQQFPGSTGSDLPREQDLRKLMSRRVGVVRDSDGLAEALIEIVRIERKAAAPALRHMATAALLVVAAAWRRRESRGAHCRKDFDRPDVAQAQRSFLTLEEARSLAAAAVEQTNRALALAD